MRALTGLAEGCRPHLGKGADNLSKVFQMDLTVCFFVQEVETLSELLFLGAVEEHVEVVEVLGKEDEAIFVLVHDVEHAIAHKREGLKPYDA